MFEAPARERERSDRFVGSVAAFAAAPDVVPDVAMTIETVGRDPSDCAREILNYFSEWSSSKQPDC
jgi:hypothetical protein